MSKLAPSDIVDEVRVVLENANKGKGAAPHFLTAYQVLNRLPRDIRERLIEEHEMPGKGAGVHHAAASVVRHALMRLTGIQVEYFDNVGVQFEVSGQQIRAGYPVCGLYRLRHEDLEA